MAEVRFTSGPTVLARPGDSLLRIAEANQVALESGCRLGMCGADTVRIVAGADNLSAPSAAERATLQRLRLPDDCRMACVARVRGAVTVTPGLDEAALRTPGAVAPLAERAVPGAGRRFVIVGDGAAGVTAAMELRDRDPGADITIVGAEPHGFYNRMAINRLLTGPTTVDRLSLLPPDWAERRRIRALRGVAARSIDRTRREVHADGGLRLPYDRLLLATGAACLVPPIEGFGTPGSFVMRTIDDVEQLRQHVVSRRCRRAIVIGGGLLGLEAGASLSQMDLRVRVLELAAWPLPRQLDEPAGALLSQLMGDLGVKIVSRAEPRRILGTDWVEGVELADGQPLKADLVLAATGIEPNVALAESAGLAVDDGVVVDDRMTTSDPAIFAAGDAAAHEGRIPGLWPVAVEQARVAAANMLGGDYRYRAMPPTTYLKVPGLDLLSVGETSVTHGAVEIRAADGNERRYRKLVVRAGRICGGILLGHHELHEDVADAVAASRDVSDVLAALERGDWSVLAVPPPAVP